MLTSRNKINNKYSEDDYDDDNDDHIGNDNDSSDDDSSDDEYARQQSSVRYEDEDDSDSDDNDNDSDNMSDSGSDNSNKAVKRGQRGQNNGVVNAHSTDVRNADLPIYERLKLIADTQEQNALSSLNMKKNKKKRSSKTSSNLHGGGDGHRGDGVGFDGSTTDRDSREQRMKHKNAPAVMPSNRPVKRLRVDANNTTKEYRDPR